MTGAPPKVFISYSHGTVEHQERVLDRLPHGQVPQNQRGFLMPLPARPDLIDRGAVEEEDVECQ
jgi:hypothetical protein